MWSTLFDRLSLRSVLILYVIVPLLFAMAAATYFGLQTMEQIGEERMQEDVQLVARAIRLPISYSLEKERFGSVSQALQSVFRIGRVYGAYVYDAQGERIAAVGAVEPDPLTGNLRAVVAEGERKGQYEKIQGRRVYSYFVPLFDTSGKSNGLLQITRKKSDFEEYIQGLRGRIAGLLTATGLFISGLVLFGFHGAAGRYFTQLAQSMGQIQNGDRFHRPQLEGPKEIATLTAALNAMLDSRDRSEKEITERRNAQLVLENKLQQSEKLAAIGQLAAGVAHELGAPLSLIDGKAQRCLRDTNISPVHESNLRDIRKQVQRMSDIVRQLLDFGKGAMRRKRWSRAAHVAGSAVSTVRKEMDGKVELLTEGPEPGPALYIDPLRFEQALINLLRNAVQTKEVTRVRLGWELMPNHEVIFTIEDNGPGIADEIKSRVFEPFFSTRKNNRNTGMGLPIVNGIIRENEGSIQLFDALPCGAGFRIMLPPQKERRQLDQGENNA